MKPDDWHDLVWSIAGAVCVVIFATWWFFG